MLLPELVNIAETRKTEVLFSTVMLPGWAFSLEALATTTEVKFVKAALLELAV